MTATQSQPIYKSRRFIIFTVLVAFAIMTVVVSWRLHEDRAKEAACQRLLDHAVALDYGTADWAARLLQYSEDSKRCYG